MAGGNVLFSPRLHAYIFGPPAPQSCSSLCEERLCFNLELPGNPPHCVSSVVSFSTNNPFSASIGVPPSKQSPETLPTVACWWLNLADTRSFHRESLCVNSICWCQPRLYFSPSSSEAASRCSTSYRCLSNTRLSGETACFFVILFCCDILFWAQSSQGSSSFSSVCCVKIIITIKNKTSQHKYLV